MQILQSGLHPFRLVGSYADPQEMNPLRESRRIGHCSLVGGLRIELIISRQEWIGRSAESAHVREQVEVIERHLEGLHAAHRKTSHGAVIAIGDGAEVFVYERYQRLRHVVV